jgi:hypothetical protein
MSDHLNGFDQWAILELLGHVKLAGRVTEEEHFGAKLGRIDIPIPSGDGFTSQYFSGGSIYRMTPTTEEIARSVAARNAPTPAFPWELPALPAARLQSDDDRAADVADFLDRYTNGVLALDSDMLDRLDAAIESAALARAGDESDDDYEDHSSDPYEGL